MELNFKVIDRIGNKVQILDQTKLPTAVIYNEHDDYREVIVDIKRLAIRGAPAIGIAGAFALALAGQVNIDISVENLKELLGNVVLEIKNARPTAVNLVWGVARTFEAGQNYTGSDVNEYRKTLWREAEAILAEDKRLCEQIGQNGAGIIEDGDTILTHCNAGALATGGIGTALAPVYIAHSQGKKVSVYSDETRPLLQGARLTVWEMQQQGIEATLICDNMAAVVMSEGKIDKVIVGTDRVAKNGDVANKIGTYTVAVMANLHDIPFYVALPYSTYDINIPSGEDIPIELRSPDEITNWGGVQTAPDGIKTYSPAFDITPAELVTGFITDKGIFTPEEIGKIL